MTKGFIMSKIKIAAVPLFLVILIDAVGWGIVYPILEPIMLGNVTGPFPINTTIAIVCVLITVLENRYSTTYKGLRSSYALY